MKFEALSVALLLLSSTPSLAIPQPVVDGRSLTRGVVVSLDSRDAVINDNIKRAGGGGGGGRGGGGGGSSSGGGRSSGSSSSSSSSSGSGSGSSSSGSRIGGGTSKGGSGVQPSYGGGRYYGGGATVPYTAGRRSPRGIAPTLLLVGALSIFPGLWLAGAYSYPYTNPYTFRNRTATRNATSSNNKRQTDDGVEQTKPVLCLCAENAVCGCDDDGNSTVLDQLIGDGSYAALNKTLVTVSSVNGTDTIVINGTLPDGTVAKSSAATRLALELSGYWVMFAIVGATVWLV